LGLYRTYGLSLRLALFSAVLVMPTGGLEAQQPAASPLADYVGTYANAPGNTLEIVNGDGLFAAFIRSEEDSRSGPLALTVINCLRDICGRHGRGL
jgi:hypothetical protein